LCWREAKSEKKTMKSGSEEKEGKKKKEREKKPEIIAWFYYDLHEIVGRVVVLDLVLLFSGRRNNNMQQRVDSEKKMSWSKGFSYKGLSLGLFFRLGIDNNISKKTMFCYRYRSLLLT
jgi:hypothetical protein